MELENRTNTMEKTEVYDFVLNNHFDNIKDSEYMDEIRNEWVKPQDTLNDQESDNLAILSEQLKAFFNLFGNTRIDWNEVASNIQFKQIFKNEDPYEVFKDEMFNIARMLIENDDLPFSEYNYNEVLNALVKVVIDKNDEKIKELKKNKKNAKKDYFTYLTDQIIKIING